MAIVTSVINVAAGADDLTALGAVESAARPATFDWSELIQAPTMSANQQQRDNFASFTDALANESFSEAEIAAKQIVELVNADAMDASARARALHNLAIAQQFRGGHESAIQNYEAALDAITSEEDNLSPALILPLRGLAIAHLDTGQVDVALQTIERALHVSNVNYGPHSLRQLPILNWKMQHYLDQNDGASALDMLERIYMLYSRKYPRNSAELLPAVYQQAELYRQLKMYAEEYRVWRHVLAIKKKHYAENDLALIEPHIRIAEISIRDLRRNDFRSVTHSIAEKHLKKALWIAENSPEDDWNARKDCLLSIADFYTLFDMQGRARRYYSAAWDLMSSNEIYLAARAEHLEMPVPLSRPKPDPYANFESNPNREKITPDDYLEGEIVMAFTVNEDGRTEDLRLVEANPANFSHMERRVRNAVKVFVYRPRYANGMATTTQNQQYRVKYFYTPSEYRASVEKSGKRVRPWQSKKH